MRKYLKRGLVLTALAAVALITVGTALAFNSGGNPGTTGPNTITWTGQGATGGVLNTIECDAQNDPNGAGQPYLLWIFTTDGGSADNAVLHLGGTGTSTYSADTASGSTFHFVTPYFKPDSNLTAYASFNVDTVGNGSWNLVISHGCPGAKDLTVSKTATPSFNKTFTWGIQKSVDQTTFDIASGGSATANYTVSVTHDSGTVGGWQVTGSITVNNPNPFDVSGVNVTDAIDNGGNCSVTGGSSATIPANDSSSFDYTCTYASAPSPSAFTNTATATWPDIGSPHTSATGTATGDFAGVTPTIVDGSVTVTDTLGGTLGTVSYTDPSPTTFTYSKTFSGVGGTCTKYGNTATFTTDTSGTTGSSSQEVTVCVGEDLQVSKTANPAFKITYPWSIQKLVDKTRVVQVGGTVTFNYTVNVSHGSATAGSWVVKGAITVTNPNDWEAITFNLSDAIDNGGTCTIDGGGTGLTVAASDTTTANYTCTYASAPDPSAFTNTATATWDKATYFTPDGTASGTATGDFSSVSPTIVDNCVSVSDPIDPNSPHTFCVGDTGDPNFSFTYSRTVNAPTLGTCQSYDNTATFTTNTTGTTGSSSQTVTVCAFNPALTPGYWKNHLSAAKFPQSLGNYVVNTQAKATAVFNAMNCSSTSSQNAIGCLAGHLLATEFNLANGSDTCIVPIVTKANNFLKGMVVDGVTGINYTGPTGTYTLTSAQRNEAIALKNALDTYNNGGGC